MVFNVDVRFEEALAKDTSLPAILVDPTRSLENSSAVQKRLASLRPTSRFVTAQKEASTRPVSTAAEREVAIPGVKTPSLSDLGTAPNFADTEDWFNTPGDRPLSLTQLRGHVVLIDFWTYTCINCLRTLPFLKGLYAQYHKYGLDIVGVETPEFTFEQEASNVEQAIQLRRHHLPRGPGQPLRHLGRVAERVLAGRVSDRRQGAGQALPVRRGQLQAGRGRRPRAARRRRRQEPAAADDRDRDHGLGRSRHARDLPRSPARPGVRDQTVARHEHLPRRVRHARASTSAR